MGSRVSPCLAARHFGLQAAGKSLTVGDKANFRKRHPLIGDEFTDENFTVRSGCMRVAFLAMDRPEIQYMGKECARVMNKPTVYGLECLKHIVRFLISAPRLVWRFKKQHMYSYVDAYTYTNWSGCPVTRRSTSCSVMMLGKHCIGVNTSTQSVIGLSSTDYGGVKSACRALGMRSLMIDLGVPTTVRMSFDSTGAKGIAAKRGAGGVCGISRQGHYGCRARWRES